MSLGLYHSPSLFQQKKKNVNIFGGSENKKKGATSDPMPSLKVMNPTIDLWLEPQLSKICQLKWRERGKSS